MNKKKRRRPIHLHVMVSEEELALIRERMAEAGVRNLGAYVRKMALNGYVLHVDLSDVRELVSLQRRCSNNLNQVAIQANTYGGIYPEEIKALQRDYETLWEPLSDLLKKLSAVVELEPLPGSVKLPGCPGFWTLCPEVGAKKWGQDGGLLSVLSLLSCIAHEIIYCLPFLSQSPRYAPARRRPAFSYPQPDRQAERDRRCHHQKIAVA